MSLAMLNDLHLMKFTAYPAKPQALEDISNLKTNRRSKDDMSYAEIERIEKKVYESDEVVQYLELLRYTVTLNYGNYFWLLVLSREVSDLDVANTQKIAEMLEEYRENYRSGGVYMPASKEMRDDLSAYDLKHKEQYAEQEQNVEKVKEMFNGTLLK